MVTGSATQPDIQEMVQTQDEKDTNEQVPEADGAMVHLPGTEEQAESSKPADKGSAAWLFLFGASIIEALMWGARFPIS